MNLEALHSTVRLRDFAGRSQGPNRINVFPDPDQFESLRHSYPVVPVILCVPADYITPVGVYAGLRRNKPCFLLESVEGGERVGRYSFVGFDEIASFSARGHRVSMTLRGNREEFESPDPLDDLRQMVGKLKPPSYANYPRFLGGAVGYVGYETCHLIEPATLINMRDPFSCDPDSIPDIQFTFPQYVLAFDHPHHQLYICANVICAGENTVGYDEVLGELNDLWLSLSSPRAVGNGGFHPADGSGNSVSSEVPVSSNLDKQEFISRVEQIKEYIMAGDIFQAVFSQRLERECRADALDLYLSLRSLNPSPYLFLLEFPEYVLLGSSPEMLFRVDGSTVEVRPIAGTRRRGLTEEEDSKLEAELLSDEKERAEHTMLVDLGRNDVGKVSVYGSVQVTDFMRIERYSHVMHIVSGVRGTLRPGQDCFDALRATFPAGTVTGAPKVRAIQIISDLEPSRRGVYAGAIGYFAGNGNADFCIAIRTIVLKDSVARVQAGAGIVADSRPEAEYAETLHKASALLNAIAMAEGR